MELRKPKGKDLIFIIVLTLLLIPQTRQPIQVGLHSLLAKFGPSIVSEENREQIEYSNWKLVDQDGNEINFKDLKGQVVFINFWATWCAPCIAEMPSLQELHDDYQDKVVFLFVSEEEQGVIKKFVNEKNYKFQVYSSRSYAPDYFETRSIPRTYVIDGHGNIVIDKKGAANWNSQSVRQLLNELIAKNVALLD